MAYELFLESFDTDVSAGRWTYFQGFYPSITVPSANNGRHSSASARISATVPNSLTGYRSQYVTPCTHVVVGAAVRCNLSTNTALMGLLSTTAGGADVRLGSSGFLEYYRGSGSLVTTDYALESGAWYHLQLGVVIGSSGSVEIRVNSETVVSVTGVDTRLGGTATTCNAVQLFMSGGNPVGSVDFEDLYFAYGDELKWLGDIRVDALALTANATPQDWTPDTGNAWERLNADAGTITGTDVGDESLFEIADFTPATSAIHAVQLTAKARKTDAGSRSMALVVKSDATEDVGPDLALSDSTLTYTSTFETDPDTSGAWTDAALDALQVGVKVSA